MSELALSPHVSVGDRVRLIAMCQDPCPVPPATLGTVWAVDALGTVHVVWDDGRTLGLVPGVDRYERLQ